MKAKWEPWSNENMLSRMEVPQSAFLFHSGFYFAFKDHDLLFFSLALKEFCYDKLNMIKTQVSFQKNMWGQCIIRIYQNYTTIVHEVYFYRL